MTQILTDMTLYPSGQTITIQAPAVAVIQWASTTTTYLTLGGNQIEVVGSYATIKAQILNAT